MNREEKTVQGIVRKLSEPQNRDLLSKVMGHIGENDSFMFTFEQHEKVDFDTFCALDHQLDAFIKAIGEAMGEEFDEDFRSMSDRYDEYLAKESDAKLSKEQTQRFNAILDLFDDGWSGSYAGHIMRRVQAYLNKVSGN